MKVYIVEAYYNDEPTTEILGIFATRELVEKYFELNNLGRFHCAIEKLELIENEDQFLI